MVSKIKDVKPPGIFLLFLLTILFACKKDPEKLNIWRPQVMPSKGLRFTDASFINANEGFIVGNYVRDAPGLPFLSYDVLLTTTDGGNRWIMSENEPRDPFASIFAINKNIVYASNIGLYKSVDGGSNWQVMGGLEKFGATIFDLFFFNEQIGFAAKNGIYKTTDGGQTWMQTLKSSDARLPRKIQFTSNKVGFAAGGATYDNLDQGIFLKTTDGGNRWEESKEKFSNIMSFFFLDDLNGFVYTFNRKGYKTTNGGNSWVLLKYVPGIVNHSYFFNGSEGYVATILGEIYRTNNGGNTWQLEYADKEKSAVSALLFPQTETGFAVTSNGTVLRRK